MIKILLSFFLFLIAIIVGLGIWFDASHWAQAPEKRFAEILKQDWASMEQKKTIPPELSSQIGSITIESDRTELANWVPTEFLASKKRPSGPLELRIQLIHWIEKNRYGIVSNFEIYNQKTQEKLFEVGRTYHIGFIW